MLTNLLTIAGERDIHVNKSSHLYLWLEFTAQNKHKNSPWEIFSRSERILPVFYCLALSKSCLVI